MSIETEINSKKNIPHVGKQPRARTKDGRWRKKRSDAGKIRPRNYKTIRIIKKKS